MARCDLARASGGISLLDAKCGTPVPDDWWFDHGTAYFMPPGFLFDGGSLH